MEYIKSILNKIISTTVVTVVLLLTVFVISVGYELRNRSHHSLGYYLGNHPRHPASQLDVLHISPWMTFDYINKVFNLPPTYLSNEIQVNDPKYPFITIKQYSRKTNIKTEVLIANIQNSIDKHSSLPVK